MPVAPRAIVLSINGAERRLTVEPRPPRLDALRVDLALTGAKKVCDMATAGAARCRSMVGRCTPACCWPSTVRAAGSPRSRAWATPQLRNMATIGGNPLQRPRCWYFREPDVRCWLQGGDSARPATARTSATPADISPCVAAHPSDLAVALLALDATVRLRGPSGERTLPIEEFFAAPADDRRVETTLGPDGLVLSVQLPMPPRRRSPGPS